MGDTDITTGGIDIYKEMGILKIDGYDFQLPTNYVEQIIDLTKHKFVLNKQVVGDSLAEIRNKKLFKEEGLDSDLCIKKLLKVLEKESFIEIAELAKSNEGVKIGGEKNDPYKVYSIIMNLMGFNITNNYLKGLVKK